MSSIGILTHLSKRSIPLTWYQIGRDIGLYDDGPLASPLHAAGSRTDPKQGGYKTTPHTYNPEYSYPCGATPTLMHLDNSFTPVQTIRIQSWHPVMLNNAGDKLQRGAHQVQAWLSGQAPICLFFPLPLKTKQQPVNTS